MALRRTPFRRVLHRPQLLFGGERELMLLAALISSALVVTGQNLVSLAVGAAIWFPCAWVLRRAAKADPDMSRIYLRHRRYQTYYPARSRPYRGAEMGEAARALIVVAAVFAFFFLVYVIG